jgi:hypothetical protein
MTGRWSGSRGNRRRGFAKLEDLPCPKRKVRPGHVVCAKRVVLSFSTMCPKGSESRIKNRGTRL